MAVLLFSYNFMEVKAKERKVPIVPSACESEREMELKREEEEEEKWKKE